MKNIQWVTLRSYFECVPWGRDLKFIRIHGKIKTKGEKANKNSAFLFFVSKIIKNAKIEE
jgi:hypothetical protein